MIHLSFIALLIGSLLPALVEGKPVTFVQPLCQPDGHLDKNTIDNGILKPINDERLQIASGKQQNGGSGSNLPPATNMTELVWSCELEQKAITALKDGCVDPATPTPPANPEKWADLFYTSCKFSNYDYGGTVEQAFSNNILTELQKMEFKVLPVRTLGTVSSNPIFDDTTGLLNYANLVRATNTEIGCAMNICPSTAGVGFLTYYCLLNGKTITNGEPLYQGTTKITDGCKEITCPAGYTCNNATLICAPGAATTTSPTTSSTITTTSASTPSSTTPAPATTTMPTSPQAEFPSGGNGGRCSSYANSNRMTDALRDEYLRLHNVRRGLLAKGQTSRADGKYLPKAANMWKMKYMCDLEQGAIEYASTCPTSSSEPSSRPGVGENFKTFPANGFTFDTAPQKSVTEWWKVIRSVNFFENVVVFRPFHDGHPISSFTQMGWATTNEIGCSIVRCRDDVRYAAVCRYRPKGNTVNSNVYQVGSICSAQPAGTTTCDADGLWS
ncbi:hypothetical protein Y032_0004g1747 [Ancylostoma ceylanicum]|uniref:SCP domain-containing protein n=1 Tax=Ancylostoma ceylanicum TaxID=53326 RepID=A0A016VTK3_9BILA|nr:hypothetical protein Y032_0004g1747 [Ancylostoma ceylanicum]